MSGVRETSTVRGGSRTRILHSVGHLHRGGIEGWLHHVVRLQPKEEFEHHVLVWTAEEEHFTQDFRDAGATVLPLPDYRNPLALRAGLRRILARHGPYHILHTHGTFYHGLVMLLCAEAGVPARIAHSHTDVRPVLARAGRVYRTYAALGHGLIRRLATSGLAVSRPAAVSMFGPHWQDDPRWRIHYCGIDVEAFARPADPRVERSLGLPQGKRIVGGVGRFEAQKNHAFLVDVAAELARDGAPVHFLLVGDGSLREAFDAEVRRRGLTHMFTVVPESREVPQLLSRMDAFAFPSLYEGLGLAAVEAQAAGLPVVLSENVPDEAIVDPVRVRRIPLAAGAAAWARALAELCETGRRDDAAFREALAASPFNVANSAARLAGIYADARGAPAPRGEELRRRAA